MTTGMAIRMAQDLGLFRDVEKWYLPVPNRFGHEEKQTRKRIWWGCVILGSCLPLFASFPTMADAALLSPFSSTPSSAADRCTSRLSFALELLSP